MCQASVDVILQELERHLVGGRGQRFDLLEDLEAVRLFFDEPLDSACLTLDPPQPIEQLVAVLGVRVAEMGGVRIGAHTRG